MSVNYLGHVAVALATGRREPDFVLGAALPDLASMVGVRIDRASLPPAVADGVACHLAADTAFHDHHAFRSGAAALRHDLRVAGLPTGPRRAIGHAGWELLLDGSLVGTDTEVAYREALIGAGAVAASVAPAHRTRWAAMIGGGAPPRLRYDDPAWVTDRLVTMLARRPRLAVPHGAAPIITATLTAHVDAVVAASAALLDDVAATLTT